MAAALHHLNNTFHAGCDKSTDRTHTVRPQALGSSILFNIVAPQNQTVIGSGQVRHNFPALYSKSSRTSPRDPTGDLTRSLHSSSTKQKDKGRTHVSVIVGLSFLGCLHTAHLFFHTTRQRCMTADHPGRSRLLLCQEDPCIR